MSIQFAGNTNSISSRALAAAGIGERLALAAISVDGGTQSRASLYQNVVEDYAYAIIDGVQFPPVIVFYDGNSYWMADGFHRYHAHVEAGCADIAADIRQGTRRDAILFSVGANSEHGLRRTNEDKRRAILTLLNDAEWASWSDREIARRCGVGHQMVAPIRESLTGRATSDERTYTTKHGTIATMNTAAIGRQNPSEENMEATVTEAAPRYSGVRMYVPNDEDIEQVCRRGLALEADGETAEGAASQIGLALTAYRVCRQIVLLADNRDLSSADAELAARSLNVLKTTLQWGAAWEIVEDLAARVWGTGNRYNILEIPAKRFAQFEKTFGIIMQTCLTTNEVELPYLPPSRAKLAIKQIAEMRSALLKFSDRIKEIHQ